MNSEFKEPIPRLMIAIAGPTSSGKTTLSYLLYEVFANHMANQSSGLTSTIVHQDAFFHPSGRQGAPITRWIEYSQVDRLPGDVAIMSTLTSMRMGNSISAEMSLNQAGHQALIDAYKQTLAESNPSGSSNRTQRQPTLHNLLCTIRSGEDRDTRDVVNWAVFTRALIFARTSDENRAPTDFNPFNPPPKNADAETRAAAKEADKIHALSLVSPDIIAELRNKVKAWALSTSALNCLAKFPGRAVTGGRLHGVAFVEGFLLLADPHADSRINGQLIGSFDAKLFLYAIKEASRKRRFGRRSYADSEREPWMGWRSESYFDGVAWPAFLAEHAWILDLALPTPAVSGLAKEFGVVARMNSDAGMEETLVWAVDSVLESLDAREAAARHAWSMNLSAGFVKPASIDETICDPLGDDEQMSLPL